jgi:hypothetical protein
MIPYFQRLLDLTVIIVTIPSDWKRATVVPVYKEIDRPVVSNYRPVNLYSLVCKQVEHVITGYLGQFWDTNKWLYEGQH